METEDRIIDPREHSHSGGGCAVLQDYDYNVFLCGTSVSQFTGLFQREHILEKVCLSGEIRFPLRPLK